MLQVFVVNRFARQFQKPNDFWSKRLFNFDAKDLDEQYVSDDFHSTTRAAGTSTNKHQDQQQTARKVCP